MQLFLNAGIIAMPILIPLIVLIAMKRWPMKWKGQRIAMRAAWVFYGLALVAFGLHARACAAGAQEFFLAWWGAAATSTEWAYAGWALQGFAVVALMFVVNWNTVRLFIDAKRLRRERAAGGRSEPPAGGK